MKYFILVALTSLILFSATVASACEIRTIMINGEIQTWQVCCAGSFCQYTRLN